MTKDEFISLLPKWVEKWGYGKCQLEITIDHEMIKGAWYINKKNSVLVRGTGDTWQELYMEFVESLESVL